MSEATVVSSPELVLPAFMAGERRVHLSGPAGVIEVALSVPSHPARGMALICHPHPLMGGNMENKVVTTLARACRDNGLVSLRFNFRGVGASAGSFAHGQGEQEDVLALAHWAKAQFQLPWRILAGFSFGAFVAAQVLARWPAENAEARPRLCLVAPPVTRFELSAQALPAGTAVIYGDADEVVDPVAIAAWLRTASRNVDITVVPSAGHFFHGQLGVIKAWTQGVCEER